jgi:hypothetical protein
LGYTPALARPICLEGTDETGCQKAERPVAQTGDIQVSARQIQPAVQCVGQDAQPWQEREAQLGRCDAPIVYGSADGSGVPMCPKELAARAGGKQPDGTAKTLPVYLGCVLTQHRTDEDGHPVRDYKSIANVSSFQSIAAFGPTLRQEALRRGLARVGIIVVLIDGVTGLENMGKGCSRAASRSWTFTRR